MLNAALKLAPRDSCCNTNHALVGNGCYSKRIKHLRTKHGTVGVAGLRVIGGQTSEDPIIGFGGSSTIANVATAPPKHNVPQVSWDPLAGFASFASDDWDGYGAKAIKEET